MKRHWVCHVSLFAMAAAMAPAAAFAQDSVSELSEIVVTATKRETVLQETPLAITALGAGALESRSIVSAADLATVVPGANFSTNGGATSITVRGVGSDGLSQPKDDPSVAAHLDGVYLSRPASLASLLYDIERVEVLRGPQGTLYGRNATGGALNIITKQPTDTFEGKAEIGVGNYSLVEARGVINIPINDTLRLRMSAIAQKHDGYSDQLNPAFEDGDDQDDRAFRATLAWAPNDAFSAQLRANIYRSDAVGQTRTLIDSRSLIGLRDANGQLYGSSSGGIIVDRSRLPGGSDPRAINTVFPDKQKLESDTYSATFTWNINDAWSVKSITGYTEFLQSKRGSSRPFLPAAVNATFDFDTTSTTWSQEFNLNYDAGGPLNFVIGAFYLNDEGENPFSTVAVNPAAVATTRSTQFTETNSAAVFGEANYNVTDAITLTAGVRYTQDTKDGGSDTTVLVPFRPPIIAPLRSSIDFDSTDYKLGLDWKVNENVFLYVSYSTAFKTGGLNTGIPISLFYKAERLKAWQGGVRSDWFDNRLRLNVDLYSYEYENPQITQVLGTSLETQNVSSAEAQGAEFSLEYRPVPEWTFTAQAAYADTGYGPGQISDIIDISPFGTNVFGRVEIGGNKLRFTPEWTFGASVNYSAPLGDFADLSATLDYFWQDDSFARPHNLPIDKIDSYSMVNATARLSFSEKRYYVEAWGRNLGDETIVSARFVNPLHLVEYRPPQTYGVRFGLSF